jgi:hypothetical protein
VRATLQRRLVDSPDPVGARVASSLLMYWYYRAQLVEGGRWLRLAVETSGPLAAADTAILRLAKAAALAVQGRVDRALPHVQAALVEVDRVPEDRLNEVGDYLAAVATAASATDDFALVTQLSDRASAIAGQTGDPDLTVLSEALCCLALIPSRPLAVSSAEAEAVYERAIATGHLFAAWIACAVRCMTALLESDPTNGMAWSDRIIGLHVRLGSRQGGPYVETRANFRSLQGDFVEATTLYSAARSHTRRAGMLWPRRPVTLELLDQARRALSREDFERSWRAGERLTLSEILALER